MTRRYRGSARPESAEITAIEPMVRGVFDNLYGPQRWDTKHPEARTNMVAFVIDTARAGAPRCIVHTQRDGTEHWIPAADVLAALNPLSEGAQA